MSPNDELIERTAQPDTSQAWENSGFSSRYTVSNTSFLIAYWNQNFKNVSEQLVLLFQDENFPDGITQGRWMSWETKEYPWVANSFGFPHPRGSTFAISLASYGNGRQLMLYTVDASNSLQQRGYTIGDGDPATVSLTSSSCTNPVHSSPQTMWVR